MVLVWKLLWLVDLCDRKTEYSCDRVSFHTFFAVDIHPPLVKLIYAGVLKAQGFVGPQERTVKWWSEKGNIIGTSDYLKVYDAEYGKPYIAMRITSAVAGAALIPVTYMSSRSLGLGRVPSLLAATFVLTEAISALQVRL